MTDSTEAIPDREAPLTSEPHEADEDASAVELPVKNTEMDAEEAEQLVRLFRGNGVKNSG